MTFPQDRRKVAIRVVGAPILVAMVAGLLYLDHRNGGPWTVPWALTLVGAVAMHELYGLGALRGITAARIVGPVCVALTLMPWRPYAMTYVWYLSPYEWTYVWPMFLAVYVLLKMVFRHGRFTVEGAALTLLGYCYVGLLWCVVETPVRGAAYAYYLLFLLAANKGSDMAAYVVGKGLGRHKMAPILSPNKTWEGAVGGAVGGTLAGGVVLLATPLREVLHIVPAAALLFVAFAVTMASQVGDLAESAFKRWAGAKDSGRLIPEFGGMLDMVDSFLVSVPVANVLLHLAGRIFSGR